MSAQPPYVGRFAPSPSGPLHRGSIVAAMASYLDAKAHQGRWLLRIEDIDSSRSRPEASEKILGDLTNLGFQWDAKPWFQSQRLARYQLAFDKLRNMQVLYPCTCSRKEIEDSLSLFEHNTRSTGSSRPIQVGGAAIYPGTCRPSVRASSPPARQSVRAWRLQLEPQLIEWQEGGWLKPLPKDLSRHPDEAFNRIYQEEITQTVGDFVIARPGPDTETMEWTYQLSVVVDDEESGVTHVVRGQDLLESTSRQLYLQSLLGCRRLRYWHCPLVLGASGQKLSKQNGALPINPDQALQTLNQALIDLGLPSLNDHQLAQTTLAEFWESAVKRWDKQMLGAR